MIAGKAEDVAGKPAMGALVTLEDEHQITLGLGMANPATGYYELGLCPAGTFTIYARRQGCESLRQILVISPTTMLTNTTFTFAGPVAWSATEPLTQEILAASDEDYQTEWLPSEWFYGQKTGLMPPRMWDQGAINGIDEWLDYWQLQFKPPECGWWWEPTTDAKTWALLALRAFLNWEKSYEEDQALVNSDWARYAAAWTKFVAAAFLLVAAVMSLGGAVGFIGQQALAWGGAATALTTLIDDFGNGRITWNDFVAGTKLALGELKDLLQKVAEELGGIAVVALKYAGLVASLAGLLVTWEPLKQLGEQWDKDARDARERWFTGLDNYNYAKNKWRATKDSMVKHYRDCTTNGMGGGITLTVPKSWDPNAKLTVGVGPGGWVPAEMPITYTIQFENKAAATAAAQQVVVTDQLATELDWSTLELQQIAFNDTVLEVPPGLSYYSTVARVGSDPNPVEVAATLDPDTGLLVWTFTSIDAGTGVLTEDPLAGFLPPNDAAHHGEGYLTFSVWPKPGWPSGTQITNQASIVFDVNPPLATQIVTNTLDAGPPTSQVLALPAQNNSIFMVQWSGEDDPGGSGVNNFDVLFSTNGTHYELWLEAATETSAQFTGKPGLTYSFYSIAVDNVGHREQAPSIPDAITTIATNKPPSIPPLGTYLARVGQLFQLHPGVVAAPGQRPVFSLAPGAPAGSRVNPSDGLFSWTPNLNQASTTNLVTLRVADSAAPSLTSEESFTVIVADHIQIECAATLAVAGTNDHVSLTAYSSVALTNLTFTLSIPPGSLTNQYVEPLAGLICAANSDYTDPTNERISLVLCQDQMLRGTQTVGELRFSVLTNAHSGQVLLSFTDLQGQRTDGTWITNLDGSIGCLTIIGEEPLLEASRGANQTITLTLYGLPGTTCSIESCATIEGDAWQAEWTGTLTNHAWHVKGVSPQEPCLFFRARKH